MSLERETADKLLADLVARAARADNAEAELRRFKDRLQTFHYSTTYRDEEAAMPGFIEHVDRHAAASIGQNIVSHRIGNRLMEKGDGAKIRTREEPGEPRIARIISVTVLLEDYDETRKP